ncbi:ribonuclease Y [Spirochaetia bacterium 38H-sp]|uniref:Ribonuclease Y n=1 Tax=Rarispira pelagica TaxID=3141764 RepID=A0ABU9UBZ0_9SPIR
MSIILSVALPLIGLALGWTARWLYAKFQLNSEEQKAERIKNEAAKEAEARKKEILFEAQEQIHKERIQLEREVRNRRAELQRTERRLEQKEENLEKKLAATEKRSEALADRERKLAAKESQLGEKEQKIEEELTRISGLSKEEARQIILDRLQEEAKHDAQVLINKIEEEAKATAERKAREIIVSTIQRIATDVTSEITVTTVSLPNDEMKGRIIGREGRNIRTLETLTGVDIIIDDTPEAVVLSCFDPVRKEIARLSLERLISDGRIHPARIEEVVHKVTREISQTVYEEGEKVLFELGIHDFSPEAIQALGRLMYRTSYGQNVLAHTKEVAILAGMLAAEVGADPQIAKRGALLHDIGKAIESQDDSTHIELGIELAKRMGEDKRVINCIAAHHGDVPHSCPESVIVQVADAISAARPGARRESLENYIKRLENLEKIAESFSGVDKAFAIQAGRELRIMVNNDSVDDMGAREMARDIAKKIEGELRYPGRIKVTIIRETRVVEYAR